MSSVSLGAVEYTYRRVQESDLPALIKLYVQSFGRQLSLEELHQKFSTQCFGAEYVGFLAIAENEEFAAFYGVFPVELRIAGQVFIAAQSGDTMTHPEHRKKGLFVHLARLTYELAREENIKLIFGFPNEQSFPGFKLKLDWSFFAVMQSAELLAERPLFWKELVNKLGDQQNRNETVRKRLKAIVVDYASLEFDGQFDGVLRDAKYLGYKQANSNSVVVRLGALTVWLVPGVRLEIGGFIEHESMSAEELKSGFLDLISMAGATSARFTYSAESHALNRIKSFCKVRPSARSGYLLLDSAIDIETLFFCRGDFDYF